MERGGPGTDLVESQLGGAHENFLDYIRRRVSHPELAEDILQDSLLRAVRAAPNLRDADRLIPWFYSILRNAIVDAYRRRGVDRKYVSEADGKPSVEPEDEAVLCECFRELIPTLKAEYAELIEALDLGAESPEAAARRLGITPNNLKVRRHRARQALASVWTRPAGRARSTAASTAPAAATESRPGDFAHPVRRRGVTAAAPAAGAGWPSRATSGAFTVYGCDAARCLRHPYEVMPRGLYTLSPAITSNISRPAPGWRRSPPSLPRSAPSAARATPGSCSPGPSPRPGAPRGRGSSPRSGALHARDRVADLEP